MDASEAEQYQTFGLSDWSKADKKSSTTCLKKLGVEKLAAIHSIWILGRPLFFSDDDDRPQRSGLSKGMRMYS